MLAPYGYVGSARSGIQLWMGNSTRPEKTQLVAYLCCIATRASCRADELDTAPGGDSSQKQDSCCQRRSEREGEPWLTGAAE
jgi:hypothetical protein